MTKSKKHKKGHFSKAGAKALNYGFIAWQLALMGAQGLGSYKLYHSLSNAKSYSLIDYIVIVAASVLAVSVVLRVAQLVSSENRQPSSTEL